MAKFKCIPNYELTRNGKTITFDIDGYYETNVKSQIDLLESCKPFIQRVDKTEKPKEKETPKKTSTPKKKAETKKK